MILGFYGYLCHYVIPLGPFPLGTYVADTNSINCYETRDVCMFALQAGAGISNAGSAQYRLVVDNLWQENLQPTVWEENCVLLSHVYGTLVLRLILYIVNFVSCINKYDFSTRQIFIATVDVRCDHLLRVSFCMFFLQHGGLSMPQSC